ncbi:DUF983 domain-containing protein [Novosphingobium sp. FKTRR1]|uniref:DUF983 domain-containing protein n=1 Tax=Novosphingobium sp. FKTRR1 TaxID=2879118 RepID=UPI00351D9A06
MSERDAALTGAPGFLPRTLGAAMLRGLRGRCPRCGMARLFGRFLKPVERCPACAQDWTLHAADDFPPYVSILITGHLMAPIIIVLAGNTEAPGWEVMTGVLALAVVMLIGMLQPAKGAIIALQWWLGMHGFAARPGKVEAGG